MIEKVTSYFPPQPQVKKAPSPSHKKPKKTQLHSPVPISHHKPHAKGMIPSQEPDRSTPTYTNTTPTPIVFPSCRAAELDWVDDADHEQSRVVAPQAQYHPVYYKKWESRRPQTQEDVHWTRAPSLSTSVSSTGSSVLLMAPKRWDSIRGRKDGRVIAA